MMFICVNMGRTYDQVSKVMLKRCNLLGGIMGVMIVGQRHRAEDCPLSILPTGFRDESADEQAKSIRSGLVPANLYPLIELFEKLRWQRNAESGQFIQLKTS